MTRGLPPPDPRSVCHLSTSVFVEPPPPPGKIPGYATEPVHRPSLFAIGFEAAISYEVIASEISREWGIGGGAVFEF